MFYTAPQIAFERAVDPKKKQEAEGEGWNL
jgi:hypothetical protein